MDHEDNGCLPMDPAVLPHDVSTGTATSSSIMSAKTVLLGMTIVSVIFFLIFFGYTAVRNGLRRRRHANWRQPRLTFSNRPEPSPHRLDQSTIDMIPVIELSLHGGETTELCAVCISEFVDGDKVRVLPQCSHRFHLECIDMWLNSHSTCPLCRSDVTATARSDILEPDETPVTESYSVYSEQHIINCPTEEAQRTLRVNNCYDQNSITHHQSPLDHVV